MFRLKAILILLAVFFGSFSSPADSQVNLKTGYNFSIMSSPELDRVIDLYNEVQGHTSEFGKLKWLHGFDVGLRLKSDIHALELNYQGGYRALRAEGQSVNVTYTDKINFAVHAFGIGYQAAGGIFGLGTDLQYQFYKTKVTSEQDGNSFKNVQHMPALKLYLLFTLKGRKGVDMALQPYYLHPFKYYDLEPLKNFIFHGGFFPKKEKWNRFGISLLFYNGSK